MTSTLPVALFVRSGMKRNSCGPPPLTTSLQDVSLILLPVIPALASASPQMSSLRSLRSM